MAGVGGPSRNKSIVPSHGHFVSLASASTGAPTKSMEPGIKTVKSDLGLSNPALFPLMIS